MLCASNPLSTQDDVAASLVANYGISTYAIKGENNEQYYDHINAVLAGEPNITMDDGADLVTAGLTSKNVQSLSNIFGGCEIKLNIAIDFTLSNGHPTLKDSLHSNIE